MSPSGYTRRYKVRLAPKVDSRSLIVDPIQAPVMHYTESRLLQEHVYWILHITTLSSTRSKAPIIGIFTKMLASPAT
jgi:hypothetical protein